MSSEQSENESNGSSNEFQEQIVLRKDQPKTRNTLGSGPVSNDKNNQKCAMCQKLNQQLEESLITIESVQRDFDSKQKNFAKVNLQLESLRFVVDQNYYSVNKEVKTQNEMLKQLNSDLKYQISNLTEELNEDKNKQKIENHQKTELELTEQIKALEGDLANKELHIKQERDQIKELQDQKVKFQTKFKDMEQELAEAQNILAILQSERDNKENDITDTPSKDYSEKYREQIAKKQESLIIVTSQDYTNEEEQKELMPQAPQPQQVQENTQEEDFDKMAELAEGLLEWKDQILRYTKRLQIDTYEKIESGVDFTKPIIQNDSSFFNVIDKLTDTFEPLCKFMMASSFVFKEYQEHCKQIEQKLGAEQKPKKPKQRGTNPVAVGQQEQIQRLREDFAQYFEQKQRQLDDFFMNQIYANFNVIDNTQRQEINLLIEESKRTKQQNSDLTKDIQDQSHKSELITQKVVQLVLKATSMEKTKIVETDTAQLLQIIISTYDHTTEQRIRSLINRFNEIKELIEWSDDLQKDAQDKHINLKESIYKPELTEMNEFGQKWNDIKNNQKENQDKDQENQKNQNSQEATESDLCSMAVQGLDIIQKVQIQQNSELLEKQQMIKDLQQEIENLQKQLTENQIQRQEEQTGLPEPSDNIVIRERAESLNTPLNKAQQAIPSENQQLYPENEQIGGGQGQGGGGQETTQFSSQPDNNIGSSQPDNKSGDLNESKNE